MTDNAGNIVVFDDITERKKVEEELKSRAEEIELANKELKARSEELKKINKAFVGRELRMVELKKEIKELKNK